MNYKDKTREVLIKELQDLKQEFDSMKELFEKDIAKLKLAGNALKQSEERFRSVTESANDAIITVDGRENIFGWNRAAGDVFGYKESEII